MGAPKASEAGAGCGEEAPLRLPGLFPPRRPEDGRTAREQVGEPHKVSRDDGRGDPGRPDPPATQSRVGDKSRPPSTHRSPARACGPVAPYRLGTAAAEDPSRGAAPGFCGLEAAQPSSPLRPRWGRAARTLPASHRPSRERALGVGAGPQQRRRKRRGARAHYPRAPRALASHPGSQFRSSLLSPRPSHNKCSLPLPLQRLPTSWVWGAGAGVVYSGTFWMCEG